MNKQQIVDEMKKRRAELADLDRMIEAATGERPAAAPVVLVPLPYPVPAPPMLPPIGPHPFTPLQPLEPWRFMGHGGMCACPECCGKVTCKPLGTLVVDAIPQGGTLTWLKPDPTCAAAAVPPALFTFTGMVGGCALQGIGVDGIRVWS